MGVIDALNWASDEMDAAGLWFGHGTDNAWDEACVLLFSVLGLPWDNDLQPQDAVGDAELERFKALVHERIERRVPAPYLTGEAWFAGLAFQVDARVLVPRSPMAELIENQFAPWLPRPPAKVLDLCTGSGCIGIAVAHYLADALVTLADISADALDVARANVQQHGVGDRCVVVESDLFDALGNERFDLIISNPPYVDRLDMSEIPPEYRLEPELGLAAGEDGLDLVRSILAKAANYLTEEGVLIVEVGNSKFALEQLFAEVPFIWLEFERGGDGVFLLTRADINKFQDMFTAAYNAHLLMGKLSDGRE